MEERESSNEEKKKKREFEFEIQMYVQKMGEFEERNERSSLSVRHSTRNYTMCWLISEMEVGIFSIFIQWLQTVVKNPGQTQAIYFKQEKKSAQIFHLAVWARCNQACDIIVWEFYLN